VSGDYETMEGDMSSTKQQTSGIERTDLQQHDLSIPGREVVQNRVDISPEAPAFKHKHPGEEIIYVLEGSLEYQVEGKPPTTVKAGEVFFVPAETIHAAKSGRAAARGGGAHAVPARVASAGRRGAHDPAGIASGQSLQVRFAAVQET
jgi:quercetin dioxygenase-like cupin family protein